MRTDLKHITIDKKIAGRYYQDAAIHAVCDNLSPKNRRKVLLVMARRSERGSYLLKIMTTLKKSCLQVFHKKYPRLSDHAKAIDDHMTYAQSTIDGFSDPKKMPQIAISVDMLDTRIDRFEEIRERLRGLMKYIPKHHMRYDTDLKDVLLSIEWNGAELEKDDLKNHKAKAGYYIRQNGDNIAIARSKTDRPLSDTDIQESGTKQDHEKEIGTKPLG